MYVHSLIHAAHTPFVSAQNFFTNVKALVSQAEAEGPKLDGANHFQQAERELTDRYAPSPSPSPATHWNFG